MATTFDTLHEDMIHDVQLNYYGRRLATCSSDRKIKIFDVDENSQIKQTSELIRHEGPVWQVAWAHPKFGTLLASAGYDRRVIIWREGNKNEWVPIFEWTDYQLSVNSIAWAPHEFNVPILATASSDGNITILALKGETFAVEAKFNADKTGVNSISWAPAISPASLVRSGGPSVPVKMLVSGGCDRKVKIWVASEDGSTYTPHTLNPEHKDWVRDVAWAPSIGLPSSTIASCSQDGSVFIWTKTDANSDWTVKELPKPKDQVVWRVSWSTAGNILAVSSSDNKVNLWRETPDGEWENISALDEAGVQPTRE